MKKKVDLIPSSSTILTASVSTEELCRSCHFFRITGTNGTAGFSFDLAQDETATEFIKNMRSLLNDFEKDLDKNRKIAVEHRIRLTEGWLKNSKGQERRRINQELRKLRSKLGQTDAKR